MVPLKVPKKREDFESDELYGEYVKQNVGKGSVVCMRKTIFHLGLNVGDLVTVDSHSKNEGDLMVIPARGGRRMAIFSHFVEILTPLIQ